jgi:hypothetical protein
MTDLEAVGEQNENGEKDQLLFDGKSLEEGGKGKTHQGMVFRGAYSAFHIWGAQRLPRQ